MNKFVKYALIATAAAVLASAAIAAYLLATFDPNTYKPQVVEWVKKRTHRTLTIPGEIKLTFLPPVGLMLGKATLSEPDSDAVFASIDELRVALGLMPLLRKKVRMEDVHIQGLQANLRRDADGRLNAADLLGTARTAEKAPEGGISGAPPSVTPDFDIKSITLANGVVTYHDEKSKTSYSVSGLELKTGRIAGNQPSSIDVSARVQGDRPQMDLAARLKSAFTFDLPADRYSLKGVTIEAKGEAGGIANFAAKAEGSVDGALKTAATDARDVTLTATGNRQGEAFEVNVALPRLRLKQEGVSGEKLVLKLARKNEGVIINAQLTAPKVEGDANAFKIADAVLDLDAARAGQTLKVTVTGPVEGRFLENTLEPAHMSVNPLGLQAVLSGEQIPDHSVTGALKGSAAIDFAAQRARVDLAGSFDQSTVRAKVGVVGFSPPGYSFDVDIDKLDLTRYQQRKPAPAQAPAPPAKSGPEPPIDLSALKNLNANGSVRIGTLTAPKLKASNVRIEVKAHDSRVDIDPLAANLYGGSLTGAIGVSAQGTPQLTVRQDLAGVNIGPLLIDLANFERIEGRGNFSVNVSTAGTTLTELKKGLNGTAAAHLADGAIKGINIAATIRQAKATIAQLKGKQQQTEVADTTQKTEFTELKATFNIRHGIASNRDLSGKSPVLRLAGEGDIDLGNDRMNYLLRANLITGQSGKERIQVADITVPVRVTGPLNAPSYSFDFATMAADLAQQALQEELQKKLGSKVPEGLPGDILQDAVKGLFKR